MARLKFILAFVGLIVAFMGWQELQLSFLADATPSPITLEELATSGPGENANLEIGDFYLCTWDYVYEEGKRGTWTEAWVPAVPLGGAFHMKILGMLDEDGNWPDDTDLPHPDQVDVLFKFTNSVTEASIDRVADQETVQGLVINEIDELDTESRALLLSSYPNVNFSSAFIFEPGRSPKGIVEIVAMLGAGLAMAFASLAMLVGGRLRKNPQAHV